MRPKSAPSSTPALMAGPALGPPVTSRPDVAWFATRCTAGRFRAGRPALTHHTRNTTPKHTPNTQRTQTQPPHTQARQPATARPAILLLLQAAPASLARSHAGRPRRQANPLRTAQAPDELAPQPSFSQPARSAAGKSLQPSCLPPAPSEAEVEGAVEVEVVAAAAAVARASPAVVSPGVSSAVVGKVEKLQLHPSK